MKFTVPSALPALISKSEKVVKANAPTILTVAGMVGTVATAILAARAGSEGAALIEEKESDLRVTNINAELSKKEKALVVWKLYIPAVGVGTMTCTSIFMANRINATRLAAMATAYAVLEGNAEEYKEKVKETFGINKAQKVDDDVAKDEFDRAMGKNTPIILTGNGTHLCYDRWTGRPFQSDMESVKQAINECNERLLRFHHVSLNDVYKELGMHEVESGDDIGWSRDGGLIEYQHSTLLSDDGVPALAFSFRPAPTPGYDFAH